MTAAQGAAHEGDGEPNPIDAPGTAEADWRSWRLLNELPILDIGGWPSVVVVAAHPDDEVLGAGGLLAMLGAARARLRLVAIPDGEASHPGMDPAAAGRLAERRAAETCSALERLGAPAEIIRLRLPDTGVARREAEAREALGDLVSGFGMCLAPWDGDRHADHEAAGRAAHGACQAAGVGLLSYPIWTWHWAHPCDPRVPWGRAVRVPLPTGAARRKRAAIGCFGSQLRPRGPQQPAVLPPEVIAHFGRDQEVLIR
ncbi:MAG: PIG-L deacetylase family protein [Streptosporangiaceae bacterium]